MRKMIPKLKILLFAACIVFIFWLNISYNGALIGIISSLWCSVLFAILWALGHCVWGLALSWKSYQSSKSDEALATLERERFHAFESYWNLGVGFHRTCCNFSKRSVGSLFSLRCWSALAVIIVPEAQGRQTTERSSSGGQGSAGQG